MTKRSTVSRSAPRALSTLAKAVCGALLLQAAGGAAAIGLKQAYEAALRNDPAFRSAYYAREGGKEAQQIARAALLPTLAASYATSTNRNDIETANATGAPTVRHPEYTSKSASLQLRQPLYNREAAARYRVGVAQSAVSEAEFSGQSKEVALRVVGAYLETLLATEQQTLIQAQRDTLLEQKRINDRFLEKGEGTRTDTLETQARLDLAEAQLIEAGDALLAARTVLSDIVGQEVLTIDGLSKDFKVGLAEGGNFEDWKARARVSSPELLAQTAALEVARQEIERAKAGHAPRLDLVATLAKSDSETISTLDQTTTQRSVGIQFNLPLYSGGAVNASTRQAVANMERARADLDAKTAKVMLEIRKQYDQVNSGAAKIAAIEKAVASGKELVKATEQSIKGGVRINLDLLNAQQQVFVSQRDLAQARYTYLVATLRLRAAAGTLGGEDVHKMAAYFQ